MLTRRNGAERNGSKSDEVEATAMAMAPHSSGSIMFGASSLRQFESRSFHTVSSFLGGTRPVGCKRTSARTGLSHDGGPVGNETLGVSVQFSVFVNMDGRRSGMRTSCRNAFGHTVGAKRRGPIEEGEGGTIDAGRLVVVNSPLPPSMPRSSSAPDLEGNQNDTFSQPTVPKDHVIAMTEI